MPTDQLSGVFDGSRCRYLRERAGLTRPMLAVKCKEAGRGVSQQHLGRIEANKSTPTPPLVVALAKALDCTFDDLMRQPGADSAGAA